MEKIIDFAVNYHANFLFLSCKPNVTYIKKNDHLTRLFVSTLRLQETSPQSKAKHQGESKGKIQ